MRKLFLTLAFSTIMQSAYGIGFDNECMYTTSGSIKWSDLVALSPKIESLNKKVQLLQILCFASIAIAAGAFIYYKWFNDHDEQIIIDEHEDIIKTLKSYPNAS